MSPKTVRDFFDNIRLWLVRMLAPGRYQKTAILHTTSRYDMFSESAEHFFAELYLHFIRQDISRVYGTKKGKILDAGCGQGRLSIPLARDGHQVTGIDISPDAVKTAIQHASEEAVSLDFRVRDMVSEPEEYQDNSFDCVICTEMIYMVEDPEAVLRTFARLVKPGGLVIVSFRPKMYYLWHAVRNRLWMDLDIISRTRGGRIHGIWLNWFTQDEVAELLVHVGISSVRMCSIGKFSGIDGDPQEFFCNPAQLDDRSRSILMDLEIHHAQENVEDGRYLYCSGIVIKK